MNGSGIVSPSSGDKLPFAQSPKGNRFSKTGSSTPSASRVGTRSRRLHQSCQGLQALQTASDTKNLPSIHEILANSARVDNTFAMKEYEIPRFDGKMALDLSKSTTGKPDWNKEKNENFIDFYTKKKAFIPPPGTYKKIDEGYGFSVKTPSLYRAERKTEITDIIGKAKSRSGISPSSYNPKRVQDKVLGTYGGLDRVTMAEAIMADAKEAIPPNKYSLPSFVSDSYHSQKLTGWHSLCAWARIGF